MVDSCVQIKLSMNLAVIAHYCMHIPEFGELLQCPGKDLDAGPWARATFAQLPAPVACAGHALEQTQHMSRYVFEWCSLIQFPFYIRQHALHDVLAARHGSAVMEQASIHLCKYIRIMVGAASEHDAIHGQ